MSGNGYFHGRILGIAANASLSDDNFKHTEVAQFHLVAPSECLGNVVQCFLHQVKYLYLNQSRLIADADDEVSFGQGWRP